MSLSHDSCEKFFQPHDRDLFFRTLVDKYRNKLHRFILRRISDPIEAEDITQNTFAEAVTSIARFRGESELFSWLAGIAMNMVRNHLSRSPNRRYIFVGDLDLDHLESGAIDPLLFVEQLQLLRKVDEEIRLLQPQMREALLLVTIDGLTYEDAAVALDVPIGTVRSRVSRARSFLRCRLKEVGIGSLV